MYGAIEKGKERAGARSIYLFLQMLRLLLCSFLLFFAKK